MTNEYITKQQAIDIIKQYEVLIGCTGVSVLTKAIERMTEGQDTPKNINLAGKMFGEGMSCQTQDIINICRIIGKGES